MTRQRGIPKLQNCRFGRHRLGEAAYANSPPSPLSSPFLSSKNLKERRGGEFAYTGKKLDTIQEFWVPFPNSTFVEIQGTIPDKANQTFDIEERKGGEFVYAGYHQICGAVYEAKEEFDDTINDLTKNPVSMLQLRVLGNPLRLPDKIHHQITQKIQIDCEGIGKHFKACTNDVVGSLNFRLHASSGSTSSWHMNSMGYFTTILMHGKDDDISLWPFAEIRHLSRERQLEVWADFAAHGESWIPPLTPMILEDKESNISNLVSTSIPTDAVLELSKQIHYNTGYEVRYDIENNDFGKDDNICLLRKGSACTLAQNQLHFVITP
ncbi:hypothetical protein SBOR_7604 [Sclerotinia borealis F-4128]|uniref:Uncharacterized protein n=1 Tax=Sclerotinia borealis (strain F-4128) TaxID=1432307 RepID=W9C5H9_SCLBF|nr:hypothetical protein SBOR_7604 [Sclerotinia borealis F-4128]